MSNVLLVEPDYRSKFPPLGLLRLATYHKSAGDAVTFVRGRVDAIRNAGWHRIYVSSLFTWELPRTVRTIRYYQRSAPSPQDVVVGGIGATLMPEYIRSRVPCTVVEGPLDRSGKLGKGIPSLEAFPPDYEMLDNVEWRYAPGDAYFCRTTKGCVRNCKFCAVTKLEPRFGRVRNWLSQIRDVRDRFGERQHLVLLDNNVLALDTLPRIVDDIRKEGFESGARLNARKRTVDFNQGIDARLINRNTAQLLARIALSPVRLALDYDSMETPYRRAVKHLVDAGFRKFTTYLMFNYNDTPESLYRRMCTNLELSEERDIRITGFPMRFVPIDDVDRQHISKGWRWRYLRGMQCVLLATRGLVSPNPDFFHAAFGEDLVEFLEILCMPDRYIIHREKYEDDEAVDWRRRFRRLSPSSREEFLEVLRTLNRSRSKRTDMKAHPRFRALLEHYYPGGRVLRE